MATKSPLLSSRDKEEVQGISEQTTPGPVYRPNVDIFEDEQALTLVVDMPGVPSDHVTIDLREDVLTIAGVPSIKVPEQEEFLLQEYDTGKFLRQFTLSEVIDQEQIKAQLTNGVLRVTLPKVAAVKPKKIQITGD
jgi:HSP20 family protein